MSGCLWADIDTVLSAAIAAAIDPATLVLADKLDIGTNTMLPAVMIGGADVENEQEDVFGGLTLAARYRYGLAYFTQAATWEAAKAAAQRQYAALRDIAADPATWDSLTIANGERFDGVEVGEGWAEVRGPTQGAYLAVGWLALTVRSRKDW
jgi:hypothetical protein